MMIIITNGTIVEKDDQTRGRQPPIAKRRCPCPERGWRMREILRGPAKARRILLQRLRIVFPKIEESPEPLFILLLVNMNYQHWVPSGRAGPNRFRKTASSGRHSSGLSS
ncbi:hypothetical protein Fot_32279 [Forsythia ovata]|uniref:Uncharacterized protein n=1 Tax=Forsythia ovata TaxID=205694 RepID=A0ABD1T7B8_9LAMI